MSDFGELQVAICSAVEVRLSFLTIRVPRRRGIALNGPLRQWDMAELSQLIDTDQHANSFGQTDKKPADGQSVTVRLFPEQGVIVPDIDRCSAG